MSTIRYNLQSMNGLETITDGISILENGVLTCDGVVSQYVIAEDIQSDNLNIKNMLKYIKTIKELKSNFKLVDAVIATVSYYKERESIFFPKLSRNLFLRRNTKDFETFEEVFIKSIYNINLPFNPTNIVDAGANVGLSTLFFKLKYPHATVDAIEIEQ